MIRHVISLVTRFIPRHQLQKVAAYALGFIAIFYRGNRFEDPINGKTYRKLLPYGRVDLRSNALAPHSLSLERHRLLWLYLKQQTNFFTQSVKLLHVAPEYCFIKPFSKFKNINYITADLNSPWAKVKMDVQCNPFPDNEFDAIICNHVLEHVPDDSKALAEFYRVMKPGGFGIFQVPIDYRRENTYENDSIISPTEREKHFGQRDHVRLYGRDYPQRLRKAGFTVLEDRFVMEMSKELVQRFALPSDEIIYLCRK